MKKLLPLLLCFAVFAGCKKEEKSETISVEGKWLIKQINYKTYWDSMLLADSIQSYTNIDPSLVGYIEFKKDGIGYTNVAHQHYGPNGSTYRMVDGFKYTINNTTLLITFENAPTVERPFTLSNDQLTLSAVLNYNDDWRTDPQGKNKRTRIYYFSR